MESINNTLVKTRFIVVAGGVISGVGKGVTAASLGKILKEHGYKVTLIKIDPYINYDAGTLRPTEHGEVWVTHDGGEIDQDLGTYERFMDADIPKQNNITTGQIYKTVIENERNGHYLGATVQFIPHITDEIIQRIKKASLGYDFAIIEIGGTAGDYENMPFLFAIKAMERELGADLFAYLLVTYLPVPGHIGEMKTKPTQQAIRLLGEHGIMPDFIICRSQTQLDAERRKKIEVFAHIPADHILAAPDIETVYQMPLELEKQELGKKILNHFKLSSKKVPAWQSWHEQVNAIITPKNRIRIAIIGKYLEIGDYTLSDSYLSICHALTHAGSALNCNVQIEWIDAKIFEGDQGIRPEDRLVNVDGIIIPGGFGSSGVEGKIAAIEYARIHNRPILGLCYGLQLMVVEFARNVCKLTGAHTTEVDEKTIHPVVDILPMQREYLASQAYGGTMRLGNYAAIVDPNSKTFALYAEHNRVTDGVIYERHRHRYEVSPVYIDLYQKNGLLISAVHHRPDGTDLVEFIELPSHPFFIATQAHPEFSSRMGSPTPLFYGLVRHCLEQKKESKESAEYHLAARTSINSAEHY